MKKIKEATVRKWLRTGHLKGIKEGRLWRIPLEVTREPLEAPKMGVSCNKCGNRIIVEVRQGE